MSKRNTLYGRDALDAIEAWEADLAECGCLNDPQPGPVHGRVFRVRNDISVTTAQCDSRSRWYNPVTRVVEGRAHCSCDYCF